MRSAIHPRLVAAGVEEEFHIVGLATGRLTGQVDRVMGQLPADRFSWEMQRSVVEANSRPWAGLAELAGDIAGLRQAAIAAAGRFGLGVVAAGTVPLADPDTVQVTADPRYERIRGEYRMLVREQLICSTQVHVDVDDRDLAIAVGRRVAPWLPALLALSASSPFWLGTDTGYASYRTLIWRRWPTAGALPGFESAAEYDRAVADLVRSGVICDPGMIYFDVRPSAHLPTLELRICDSCPALADVVLLAGLFRALVIREIKAEHEGLPPVSVRPGLLEAATWRAAQAGLQGDLVDPVTAGPVPASRLIGQLLAGLRPALESTGDWDGEPARPVGHRPGRLSGTAARRPPQRRPPPRRRHAHRRNPRRPAMGAGRPAGRVTPTGHLWPSSHQPKHDRGDPKAGGVSPWALTPARTSRTGPGQRRTGRHQAGTARTERTCHEPLSRHRTPAACRRTGLLDLR
jgi:YbdK family carboxylate-amine ligase